MIGFCVRVKLCVSARIFQIAFWVCLIHSGEWLNECYVSLQLVVSSIDDGV